MNVLPKIFQYNLLPAIILILPLFVFASDTITVKSTVIFNTACARCHEGECSGRMSFHLPEEAANQHIRRHGGDLSLSDIRHLFKLLRYMKEECSFYPLPHALMNDQKWDRTMLDTFRSPSRQAYFMPLGLLKPGMYQLSFEALDNTKFCAEIINEEFDFSDKDSLFGKTNKKELKFHAEQHLYYFLRLTAQQAISLEKLTLIKSKRVE